MAEILDGANTMIEALRASIKTLLEPCLSG